MSDFDAGSVGSVDTGSVDAVDTVDTGSNDLGELFDLVEGKDEQGNNKTRKVSRDELLKLAQKGFGADKTFSEAAKSREEAAAIKAQMAELARMLQEDPFKVMRAFGKEPDSYISKYFDDKLQESLIDPKDRRMSELEAKLAEYEEEKNRQREEEQRSMIERRSAEIKTVIFNKIDEALQQAGVPKNPRTVAEIGRYLQSLNGKTGPDGNPLNIMEIPVSRIVKHIQSSRTSEFQDIFSALDDDALLNSIDPKLAERIGRALSKKLAPQVNVPIRGKTVQSVPEKVKATDVVGEIKDRIKKAQLEWEKVHGKA